MNCVNHAEREKVAFCQVCGRPLCEECVRRVGSASYCEPDLAAMLGQATGQTQVPPQAGVGGVPPMGAVPRDPSAPNPGLAALLGFIPGVGAMYNGQMAKGLIHIGIFMILVSLSDKNGLFGLFVAGWIFYQVIDAYQTAVAKRDGKPVPNPLGLNDIGARMNSGQWWQQNNAVPPVPPVPGAARASAADPYGPNPYGTPYAATAYSGYGSTGTVPPPVSDVPPPASPSYGARGWRYGSLGGAVWMILVGVVFLVGMVPEFHFIRVGLLLPVALMAWGAWTCYITYRDNLQYMPSASSGYLLARCAHRGGWMVMAGLLWLLDTTNFLHWGSSWPFLLIFAGVIALSDRFFPKSAMGVAPGYSSYGVAYVPDPVVTPPPATTSIVPRYEASPYDAPQAPERGEEGR